MWLSCSLTCTFCTYMTDIFLRTGTSWNSLMMLEAQAFYRVMRQSGPGSWGVFTADWSDVFSAPWCVQIKENSPTISCDPEVQFTESSRYLGVTPSSIKMFNLCNKRWQRLCVLMRTEKCMSSSYSSCPINPQKLLCGLVWNLSGAEKCQYWECNKLDHFHSTDRPRWRLQWELVKWATPFWSQIQTTTS